MMLFACETYDHTPPEVIIDSPNALAPVMDITRVEITATDDEEMAYVELLVDGEETSLRDSTLPYLIDWSTYDYENQSDHILIARAWDASENYSDSEPVRVRIVNDDYYPASIDVIQITYEDDGFTLLWDESAEADFESYTLRKYAGSLLDSARIAFQSFDVAEHSYRDEDVDPLVQYYYRITVTDTFGLATAGRHNLSPDPRDYAPSSLTSSGTDNTIKLRWVDNSPFESGFIIERDEGAGFTILDTVKTNTTGYSDENLEYDIYYRYRVAALTQTNQSEYSSYTGISSPLKFAPSNLAASTGDTTITLSWVDNSLFEQGFRIERSEGDGYIQIGEVSANVKTFTDSVLDEGEYYLYRVAAFTTTLQSNYSNSLSVTSPVKFAPSSLTSTTTETTIRLRWDDNCIFEAGFVLQRDEGLGFSEIARLPINTVGYIDTNLVYNQTYRYQVAAHTSQKQSDFTNTISVHSPLLFTPTNLSAQGADTAIVLRWEDNCIFEDGFIIERRSNAGYVRIATLGADSISYVDSEIFEDEFYTYRIAAYTQDSQSDYSAGVSIASPIKFAPSGLSAASTGNTIVLRWNDNSLLEEGFVIERDDGSGYEEIAQLGYNYTTFVDDSLEYDKLYNYRVAAFTSEQQSNYSNTVTIQSPISLAPTGLAVTPQETSIRLTWSDNSDFEEGYIIERDEGAGFDEIARVRYNYTYFTDDSLTYGTLYTYRVAAYVSSSVSAYTNTITIDSPLKLAPTNLTGFGEGAQINLSWQDNSIIEDGFRIERDAGTGFVQVAGIGPDTSEYTDSDLSYDTEYRYRVRAFVGATQSVFTPIITLASPLKFSPTSLASTVSDTTIHLSWTDNSIFEDGFKVERDAGSGFVQIAELVADVTTFDDSDLTEGGNYSYRVFAFEGTNNSGYTNVVDVNSPVKFTPTNLTATSADTTISLAWDDDCLFEDGFRVERDAGTGYVQIAALAANITSYDDSDLEENSDYSYRVNAFEGGDNSGFSNEVTIASPVVFTPTGLSTSAADTTITLTWTDGCLFEDGFVIERDAGAGFMLLDSVSANTTSYEDVVYKEDQYYSYRIFAYTGADSSGYSGEVSELSPAIFTPTNLLATVSSNSVHLEWDDDCLFEDGFRIERDSGLGFVQIAEIGTDITDYADNYLSYGTDFSYRVLAYKGADQSSYSNTASATIEALNAIEWVTVLGGDYSFGTNPVDTLSDLGTNYDIMKYEVTNAQYVAYLEEALATFAITPVGQDSIIGPFGGDGNWPLDDYLYYDFTEVDGRIGFNGSYFTIEAGYENHPVVAVTWFGANAFAQHYGWDLPTGNEWEKAARGIDARRYPWGDEAPTCDLANFSNSCNNGTVAVGQTSGESAYGAYDMVGNVWEWTSTYDPDVFDGTADNRTIRGGSWSFYSEDLYVWNWEPASPKYSYYRIGFRCVK